MTHTFYHSPQAPDRETDLRLVFQLAAWPKNKEFSETNDLDRQRLA
jgi:hypothetical protein